MPVPHHATFAAACLCAAALLLMLTCAAATESAVPTPNKAADLPPPIVSAPSSTGTLGTPASNHSEDDAPHQRRAFAGAYFEIGPGAPSYVVLPGTYWVRFSNGFYLCAFDDNTLRQTPRMYGWERITVLPGPTPGTSYLYSQFHNKYIIDPVFLPGSTDRAPVQSPVNYSTESAFLLTSPITLSASREVRIGGASVNQPRGVGSYPYRIASPRFNSNAELVETTYLRAPTTGEYEGFVYKTEGAGFVPPPEMDFISVRTLGAGDFWVKAPTGRIMCVFSTFVGPVNLPQPCGRIRVIKANELEYGRSRYHLWSDAYQRYLAFGPSWLALRTYTESWETFRIVSHPKHYEKFSIFSDFHGKFLGHECWGCGFVATMSNTDAANEDATAWDFIPIDWFSDTPFKDAGTRRCTFQFEATGKYLAFDLDKKWAKQTATPYDISLVVKNEPHALSGGLRYSLEVRENGHVYLLDNNLLLRVSGPGEGVVYDSPVSHLLLPHPKMPRRYIIKLCRYCQQALYLAADPNGFDLTTTNDAASDYTAIDIPT